MTQGVIYVISDLVGVVFVRVSIEHGKFCYQRSMGKSLEGFGEALLMRRMAFDWILSRRQRAALVAHPQT